MSFWTQEELQKTIDALKQQLMCDPLGAIGSVSVGGRTVAYRSVDELRSLINFYARELAALQRTAAGGSRHGYRLARFP